MAWSPSDLDTIEAAIANPEEIVRFADGREVRYARTEDLLKARDAIKSYLDGAGSVSDATPGSISGKQIRCTFATFTKD